MVEDAYRDEGLFKARDRLLQLGLPQIDGVVMPELEDSVVYRSELESVCTRLVGVEDIEDNLGRDR